MNWDPINLCSYRDDKCLENILNKFLEELNDKRPINSQISLEYLRNNIRLGDIISNCRDEWHICSQDNKVLNK